MPMLYIKCPNTGEPVATGFDLPASNLQNTTLTNNSVGCPHCGQTHTWNKSDAFFLDESTDG